jgi:hypothetical protein
MGPNFLYKYKSGDKRDVKDLLADKLWVSKYRFLNDPCDLMFNLNKEKLEEAGVDESNLEVLLNRLYGTMYEAESIISFGINPKTPRLWNYYAGGFRGFVACYRKKDVEKSLELADKHNWCPKAVVYTNETTDMTDAVIELIKTDPSQRITPRDWPDFFSKGIFWRGEHEFRYSVGNHFFKGYKRGRRLHNLKSCKVYLGFRFEKQQAVIDYCKKNEIPCFICRPDFFGDIKETIIEKVC